MLSNPCPEFEGYQAADFHKLCGLVGKGEHESGITILNAEAAKGQVFVLSPMDMPEPFTWTPFLFPFENVNKDPEFMNDDMLLDSLQKCIERVPIVTGHLERIDGTPVEMTGPNSDMKVIAGSKGVWYTSTQIPGSFQDFKSSGFNYEVLHPNYLFRRSNEAVIEGKDYSLLAIKVSRFPCGSLVILVSMCHMIGDARSAYEFVRTWSSLSRNQLEDTLTYDARHLYSYDSELSKDAKDKLNGFLAMRDTAKRPQQRTKLAQFQIPAAKMLELKQKINSELAPGWVSTDDILSILGWRALLRARQVPKENPTKLVRVIDIRKHNQPPLPMHSFGNGVSIYMLGPQSTDLALTSSIAQMAKSARDGIAATNPKLVRAALTAIAHLPFKDHPLGGNTIPFSDDAFTSSYAGFKPSPVNFHNSPCLTMTRGVFTEGLILPHPIYDNSLSVKVGINSDHLQAFLNDPELKDLGFRIYA